jgi:hypothetical protein
MHEEIDGLEFYPCPYQAKIVDNDHKIIHHPDVAKKLLQLKLYDEQS